MAKHDLNSEKVTQSQWKTLSGSGRFGSALTHSSLLSLARLAPAGPLSPLIAFLVVGVLLGMIFYVEYRVRESLRAGIGNSLQTVLAANVSTLEFWFEDQRQAVLALSQNETVREIALGRIGRQTPTKDFTAKSESLSVLDERLRSSGHLGWAIIDLANEVLFCSDRRFEGHQLPISSKGIARLQDGDATVTRPLTIGLDEEDGNTVVAAIIALAPIREGIHTLGAIALLIDPSNRFGKIWTVAQIGESGETYAFDRQGLLLSKSRFESQLTASGLLQDGQASPFTIRIRDPGTDIRFKKFSTKNRDNWPLTKMADAATRGGDGIDVVGYRDYRGVKVVGAWRWLEEYEFGVATELDTDEAFDAMNILRNSFMSLVAAALVAGVSLVAIAWMTRKKDPEGGKQVQLNRRLGQYDLNQRIGRGGMGTVYLGKHALLDRRVAIKVLENTDATERSLARFEREVRLSAKLMHPNTIEIYDFGCTEDGTFFYVMEFVDGISLEQLVDYYDRQPADRVIYLLIQICGSIAEAHDAGLVHRDIKPANILLTSRSGLHDLVKVVDFGLAKQLDHDSMQLTRTDSLTGTPLYMSPESIRDAAAVGVLSDIYAIGAVGYMLLTGSPPFTGDSTDVCARKLHEEPEPPECRINAALPDDLQMVLMRCLKLDPNERPQSANELASELLRCANSTLWTQIDACLWWQQIFDGPYLDDFEAILQSPSGDGTRGDTAVNATRPPTAAHAGITAS